ncbi:hypothetical protein AGABI2DRAFT_179030 [Agaricus bisporus var. bisporus H97]|uniref:hypothetical protein n=1 Tax=Agaricus bisporus var. bisporus (strain H97 / ATCC MYA-4626 / FGSC 10389) TaxID=936046 RepID=UPI00029F5A7E|nr:hypothetical protein AGABI2DRAFT_179030 [Agaricus bisporus var. bisporus H97]EKV46839.1 hypothetical protein AGABI2DRAFT_179030 [Agaricus bisporus var. bisporus H97]
MSFVRRRLATETVNVFKSAFKDRRRGKTENIGWETPLARIARTLTWILQRPKSQGLTPNTDGFFRVRDVLKHPSLEGLDFLSIERAVRTYRPHHITLVYSPQKTANSESSSQVTSWWIALHSSRIASPSRRLIHAEDAPDMVYKVPTAYWETIRQRGLSRKFKKPFSFSTENIVPPNHEGDYTFIRLDPQKLLNSEHASKFPIYSTHTYSTKPRFHEYSQTFTTHAPIIPPSTFKSVIRVAVERFPLMVRARKEKIEEEEEKTEGEGKRRWDGGYAEWDRSTREIWLWRNASGYQVATTIKRATTRRKRVKIK